jgi:proline iminopeptidase
VQLHYLVRGCFLAPDQLMTQVEKLRYIPAIVVQGRRDLVCPPSVAYALSQRWPTSELRMVEEGGHSAFNTHMAQALVQAIQDMRERVR